MAQLADLTIKITASTSGDEYMGPGAIAKFAEEFAEFAREVYAGYELSLAEVSGAMQLSDDEVHALAQQAIALT